jgi:hypothetical protein
MPSPCKWIARNLHSFCIVGHADTRMVEKHYGHLAPSCIADAIRADAPHFAGGESNPTVVSLITCA